VVKAFLGEHPDHPATAPVHGRGFANHDARLERVLDVIEAPHPAAELLFEARHVLPSGLVRLPRDDPDQLQLVGVVGVDDRLHRPLEHVVGLGVGGHDAEMEELERVGAGPERWLAAESEPVLPHVPPHPQHGAVDARHDADRAEHPVGVEDQHHDRHENRPGELENDRDPGRREQHDPGERAGRRLEGAGAKLPQGPLPGRRHRRGGGYRHGPIMAWE